MKRSRLFVLLVCLLAFLLFNNDIFSRDNNWEDKILFTLNYTPGFAGGTRQEILLWPDDVYEEFTLVPGELSFFWPMDSVWGPTQASAISSLRAEYHEGGLKALEIYKQLFGLAPPDTMKVRIVDMINLLECKDFSACEPQWAYYDGLSLPQDRKPGQIVIPPPEDLIIYLPFMLPVPWEHQGVTIAHEIAHLFQFFMTGRSITPGHFSTDQERSGWIVEGGAQFMASLVYPEPAFLDNHIHLYEEFADSPEQGLWGDPQGVDGRTYSAYPFFRWIEENYDQNLALDIIESRFQGMDPQSLIDTYSIDEMWFDYVRKAWTDKRYYRNEYPIIQYEEINLFEEYHHSRFELDPIAPYAAEYILITTDEDPPYVFRLHLEEFFGEDSFPDTESWLKVGAMVKSGPDTWKDVDISGREFVQFVQGNGQDTENTIYHMGDEVAVVVTITGDLVEANQYFEHIKDKKIGVSIGLPTVWQLGQLRITESPGEEPEKINVLGLVTLMALPHENGMRLHQKTRHFWPNFKEDYYQDFLDSLPDDKAPFRSGKTLERIIEDSCKFWGRQIFDIVDVAGRADQFEDPDMWDQKLTYHLKPAEIPILPGTVHRFTCVPNPATSKGMLLSMFGGAAQAAVNAVKWAKWLNEVWVQGYGDASFSQNLEDLFVNLLTFGFGENGTGRPPCSIPEHSGCGEVAMKFVQSVENNYLVVEVNDKLSLIYRQVKR